MAFTAKDVQALREKTGVGMMDCKKALAASDGDMDKAIEFLREKGLAASRKKPAELRRRVLFWQRSVGTRALSSRSTVKLTLSPRTRIFKILFLISQTWLWRRILWI